MNAIVLVLIFVVYVVLKHHQKGTELRRVVGSKDIFCRIKYVSLRLVFAGAD